MNEVMPMYVAMNSLSFLFLYYLLFRLKVSTGFRWFLCNVVV
jgi:hypothetical protein